jgi:ethanolamine utilization protein EutQ
MKRVITAQTVKQAHAAGKTQLYAPAKQTLITPEARTVAKDLGIRFIEYEGTGSESVATAPAPDEKTVRQIVERVMNALPPEKRNQARVQKVVAEVLASYLRKNA